MEDNFLMFGGKKYLIVDSEGPLPEVLTNPAVEPVVEAPDPGVVAEAPVEVAPEAPVAPVEGEVKE